MYSEIEPNVELLGTPITLTRSFVVCYGKQVLTHAIWLIEGEIIVKQSRKLPQVFNKPGLYFYHEFVQGKALTLKVEVSVGSKILILTKSELTRLGLALPA